MVDKVYCNGKVLNMVSYLEIDVVIDLVEICVWFLCGLVVVGELVLRVGCKWLFVDIW